MFPVSSHVFRSFYPYASRKPDTIKEQDRVDISISPYAFPLMLSPDGSGTLPQPLPKADSQHLDPGC
jgi:hypothetical protein